MKKPVVLLSIGMIGFVVWLTLCLINPWAGFILSLCVFIGLAGFIIFILICYVIAVRGNKRAQTI
jgi:preprotein translocase subunit Sss1